MRKTILLTAFAIATTQMPTEAHAFFPFATCSEWSSWGSWGGPSHTDATATLEQLQADGSWLAVATAADKQTMSGPGDIFLGSAWGTGLQGTFRVSLAVSIGSGYLNEEGSFVPTGSPFAFSNTSETFSCSIPGCPSVPRTSGFWNTNQCSWPHTSLTIAGQTYPQTCLVGILNRSAEGDIRLLLMQHLIATRLNHMNGANAWSMTGVPNSSSTSIDTANHADALLTGVTIDCNTFALSGASPSHAERGAFEAAKNALDAYTP